jgi:hypothetical protein
MTGAMAVMMNNNIKPVVVVAAKTWTGVTAGLVFDLLNAPSSGTSWTDASGNGYNATLQGTPTYTASNGGGIILNNSTASGGTDYISVPYNISSGNFTVEIVASFNPTSTWATVWGNEVYTNNQGFYAYMGSSTGITYGAPSSNIMAYTISASNSIRHWVFTYAPTGTNNASIYLNGSILTQSNLSNQTAFATSNFFFGARHNNNGTGATDKMNNSNSLYYPVFYQMRVYNTTLTSANVTTNYNAVKSSVSGGYGLP